MGACTGIASSSRNVSSVLKGVEFVEMATICGLVSSSYLPSSRLGQKTRGMRTISHSQLPSVAVTNPSPSIINRQDSSLLRFRERKKAVCGKALQKESSFEPSSSITEYTPGPLDDIFLKLFRRKMTEEVGWESKIPGYDGLIEVVKHQYARSLSKEITEASTVRVLISLFPTWLLPLFRNLIAPLADGKLAAVMTAFVTQATCQWLMGPCTINEVTLADGSTLLSGVYVQKCKFLEKSKCAGICTHICKIPTQTFIKEGMAIPLTMEPNFSDFSCQFKYGVEAPPRDEDPGLQTPCLSICPTAATRASLRSVQTDQCPQV